MAISKTPAKGNGAPTTRESQIEERKIIEIPSKQMHASGQGEGIGMENAKQ